MKQEIIRYQYQFYGLVQGVGFRYHARYQGEAMGLTGWVENCYDGTVLAQVQGSRDLVLAFPEQIEQGRYIRIEKVEGKEIPLREGEYSFEIKY